jgi:ABC-type phosphate transport system substrate-binding protein
VNRNRRESYQFRGQGAESNRRFAPRAAANGSDAARAIYTDAPQDEAEAGSRDMRAFTHCAYPRETDPFVHCSTTPRAYEHLIEGEVDMIFAFAPFEAQRRKASEKGLILQLTPIVREAFVFLMHAQNPVGTLKAEILCTIYSGQMIAGIGYVPLHCPARAIGLSSVTCFWHEMRWHRF